jgi:hypothetical protein
VISLPHAFLETIVAPFTTDFLASYLSLLPSVGDAVLSFGPIDMFLTPAQHYIPTRLYTLFPHPAQDSVEKRKYIAVLSSRSVPCFNLPIEMLTYLELLCVICIPKAGVRLTAW